MTVDRDEANALLNDVAGIEDRVRELLIYSRVSDYLFLWGVIWLGGFTANYFLRDSSGPLWIGLQLAGLAGTVIVVTRHMRYRPEGERNYFVVLRAAISMLAIVGFGTLWLALLDMGWREQITFWPTLLAFLLFMFGLWVGRSLAIAAVVLFVLALTGYFVAGNYLHLWMAAVVGGGMIAGGFWLRR
jgi:hypothetical protein